MNDRAFQVKVAMMRKAQTAYWARAQKNDWKSAEEKTKSILYCKKLEAEVDNMLKETFGKEQTLFNQ